MFMKTYDYIIVGSGLYGTVMAERLKSKGKSVMIIEKRDHIGGNCYTVDDKETGINIHKYGTHIFHTSKQNVWKYINKFTAFNRYQHKVFTTYNNRVYNMPVNLHTINSFYGVNLKPAEIDDFMKDKLGRIKEPKNFEEKAICMMGWDLYSAFIKGYTMKQWDCHPRKLPAAIIDRIPMRKSFFDLVYQGKRNPPYPYNNWGYQI